MNCAAGEEGAGLWGRSAGEGDGCVLRNLPAESSIERYKPK